MTAPLMPQASGLTTPTPVTDPNAGQPAGPVRDRAYWANVLHNAAQVPQSDSRYGDARAVIGMALDNIQAGADSASLKDTKDITPGPIGTALVNFGHGASAGLASTKLFRDAVTRALKVSNPILGAGFEQLANDPQGYQQYRALANAENPKTAFGADLAGGAALSSVLAGTPVLAGLKLPTQMAITGGAVGATRGATDPFAGLSRAESAAIMGGGGVVAGALLGKFVSKAGPVLDVVVKNLKQWGQRLIGSGAATATDVEALTEAAIRAKLAELKVAPDLIERAVQSWKTTGALTVKGMAPPPPPPMSVRPGETITQTSPRGFEVTGTRATPPPPTSPSILEMQQGFTRAPGAGQTPPQSPYAGQAPNQMPMMSQQDAARNAFNQAIGMGVPTDVATAGARNVAGFHAQGWDPRQALLLALLLGHKPTQ